MSATNYNAASNGAQTTESPSFDNSDYQGQIHDVDGKLIDYGKGAGSGNFSDSDLDSGSANYTNLNHSASSDSAASSWFNANDDNANYQSEQQREKFQRLKRIDEGRYKVYKNPYWKFHKLNPFLAKGNPRSDENDVTEIKCRTKAVANEVLSIGQAQYASNLMVEEVDLDSGSLNPYTIEEVAIVLCRLIADKHLPSLKSVAYPMEKVSELELSNKSRMDERMDLVFENSNRGRELTDGDVKTIKQSLKSILENNNQE